MSHAGVAIRKELSLTAFVPVDATPGAMACEPYQDLDGPKLARSTEEDRSGSLVRAVVAF